MKKLLVLTLLIAGSVFGQLTWTQYATGVEPYYNDWTTLTFDSTTGKVLGWLNSNGTAIYSNAWYEWDSRTHIWGSKFGATGTTTNTCPADTASAPGDRHPLANLVNDPTRNYVWFWGGVCGGVDRTDMGYVALHGDPTTNTFVYVTPSTTNHDRLASGVWDSTHNCILSFGFDGNTSNIKTKVYCPTINNPTPGTLTASQALISGAQADNWVDISPATQPTGAGWPFLAWDPVTARMIMFGGYNNPSPAGPMTETWAFNPVTDTWTNKSPASNPGNQSYSDSSLVGFPGAYNPQNGKVYYHVSKATPEDWVYDPSANTWTMLCNCGGARDATSMGFNASGTLVAWAYAGPGFAETWQAHINGGSLSIPLTVQEAIYPGLTGVARTNEPFCQGVPIADSAGIVSTSVLGLTSATAGQFRILGTWPSGNAKWIEVCGIISSLTAGGTTTVTLTNSGSGDFGGSNIGTDNGSTLTLASGTMTCTVKKANFNGCDVVDVGATHVVLTGTSDGFVVTGPANPGVTCGTCTTAYKSSNDASSTCSFERNGPVVATALCTFDHKDGSGNVYMHGTARLFVYKNKSWMKVNSSLRNADYGTSNSFAAAYKGHQGYEYRMVPNISGTLTYTVGNDTGTPTSGTMTTSDTVYNYQAFSSFMQSADWCNSGCVPYTTDTGFIIKKNASTLTSGTTSAGWADIANGSGAGIEIGGYQMAAYSPMSLEFNNGTDVRIGIWARENSQPYYMPWVQYSIHDLFVNYHSASLSSPSDDFERFQAYLVARASYGYYNSTGVFPYTLTDPTTEDNYYAAVGAASSPSIAPGNACCLADLTPATGLAVYRFYYWPQGGGSNQAEFRWSDLQNFIKRGYTGRWLNSAHFYRMQAEKVFPRSDGFTWRSKSSGEVDSTYGFPTATSTNASLSYTDYIQFEHEHWYGMMDYYFLTGDETIKDALNNGALNYFLETRSAVNSGANWNSRAVGSHFMGAARMAQFLDAINDTTNEATVLSIAQTYPWTIQVKPNLCLSGYPSGCSTVGTQGVSPARGVHYINGTDNQCTPGGVQDAAVHGFMESILTQGLWELKLASGPTWTDSWKALDAIYGVSKWQLTEFYNDDGTTTWTNNGFRYNVQLRVANNCGSGEFSPQAQQTVWTPFFMLNQIEGGNSWTTKFNMALRQDMSALGMSTSDFGQYQVAYAINSTLSPGSYTLQDLPLTCFTDNGGGSYTICWTTPVNTQYLRVKYDPLTIVDWIGFDAYSNTFTGNPATTQNWFAATNASGIPDPVAGSQSMTIATGTTGLSSANFSVKAFAASSGSSGVGSLLSGAVKISGSTVVH